MGANGRIWRVVFAAAITAIVTMPASGQQTIAAAVKEGCAKELQTYCTGVTAGEGRLAACLYAYEDKISMACAVAVYNGVVDMQKSSTLLEFYADECDSDLLQYCGDVTPGGGRLYQCLAKNKATLTDSCRDGLGGAEQEMRKLGLVQ